MLVTVAAVHSAAQTVPTQPIAEKGNDFSAEKELARLAVAAHGGDKLRALKTLIIRGSVDVTTSAVAQAIPATFVTVFAGDRYRFELNNPFQPIKQVNNGVQTLSTIQNGFMIPPVNRLGFPLLPRIGEPGFVITSLPEGKKKQTGFRLTSPEGYYTDFYLEAKSNRVKAYDAAYTIGGRTVTTSVEVDKLRLVDGILVPEKYAQRFDLTLFTVYAAFRAKEILVNVEVADDVFTLGG